MKKTLLTASVFALCLSAQARAEIELGWYLKAGLGQSTVQDPIEGQDLLPAVNTIFDPGSGSAYAKDDDTDTTWRISVGHQFDSTWAVEASYIDFGETSAIAGSNGTLTSGMSSFTGSASAGVRMEARAISLGATFGTHLNNAFYLYGKGGLFFFETDTEISVLVAGSSDGVAGSGALRESEDESGNSLFAGIGLSYHFTPGWGLSAEWERYTDVEGGGDESSVDIMMLSLQHRF